MVINSSFEDPVCRRHDPRPDHPLERNPATSIPATASNLVVTPVNNAVASPSTSNDSDYTDDEDDSKLLFCDEL